MLPWVSAEGIIDIQRAMSYRSFVQNLRRALVAIGLTEEQASFFAGQSVLSGGVASAAMYGLRLHVSRRVTLDLTWHGDIQHLAGVKYSDWLSYYNRNYLGVRLQISRAVGL